MDPHSSLGFFFTYNSFCQKVRGRKREVCYIWAIASALISPANSEPPLSEKTPDPSKYVESRAVGTKREEEPPRYATDESKLWERPGWLDLGAEYRLRYEYRRDDLRRSIAVTDHPFLHRSRLYVGIRKALDPLRIGVEVAEARRGNSRFLADNRDSNHFDLLQGFLELYFENAIQNGAPLRLQAGRLATEYLDRRLIARNEWRNTTNTFEGARIILGSQKSEAQLDFLALKPVVRSIYTIDQADTDRVLYGAIGDVRRWSKISTVQPYYLLLKQDSDVDGAHASVHTLGVRSYGVYGTPGFDYDLNLVKQFGKTKEGDLQAFAAAADSGYKLNAETNDRVSVFLGYASGDKSPGDGVDEHFNRLFGFARPWSSSDYISWENILTPKLRYETQPIPEIKLDGGYSAYWLASRKDGWPNTGLRNPDGAYGRFLGQELDFRARMQLTKLYEITLGYAHFFSDGFTTDAGRASSSDFFYVQNVIRLN